MKISIKKLGICCAATSFALFTQAQETWSLRRCIDYAIENNITVRQQSLEMQNQEITLHTSRMSRLPDLNANVGQNFYFGRGVSRDGTTVDQNQANSSLSLSTSLPVFTGFRIPNQIAVDRLDLKAATEGLNKAKEDVALNVTSYYLQVLFNNELLRIAQEQVVLSQSQLTKTEILVREGKSSESALYESRALLAKDELNLTQNENNLSLSILNLTQLLNLEQTAGFKVEIPQNDQIQIAENNTLLLPDDVFAYSVQNRPAIKEAHFALESSKRYLKVAQSGYYPKLSLGASYNNGYYHSYTSSGNSAEMNFNQQLRNNGSESIGLSLSIPLFNRFTVRNQVRQARINISRQELALQNARQILYKEIEQAYQNAVAAHKKFSSAGKAVESAQIAFSFEEQKYSAGKSTSFEYNDAKSRYEKSLSEEVQARYEFIFSSKVLDFYNGQPLEL